MVLIMFAHIAFVQATPNVNAFVDLTAVATPFPKYWQRCVGSGHMLLGTRADWRHHLKLAADELGFQAIRGHGLLDDDMSGKPRIDAAPPDRHPTNARRNALSAFGSTCDSAAKER